MNTRTLLLVCALVAIAAAMPIRTSDSEFEAWMAKHGRVYRTTAEHNKRLAIFQENKIQWTKMQVADPGAQYGATKFADLSREEFAQKYLMKPLDLSETIVNRSCLAEGVDQPGVPMKKFDVESAPTSVDWVSKGAVTPVKNQGQCGSCWAFSTTGNIEGQHFLAGNPLVSLSEQDLVDCAHDCQLEDGQPVCNSGCEGGWPWLAMESVISWGGLETEDEYPYVGMTDSCQLNKTDVVSPIANFSCYPHDEDQMAAGCAVNGPISVAIDAGWMQYYLGGVADPLFCSSHSLDHAVLIVGYDTEKGIFGEEKPYWLIKNSWGATWGEKGYGKLIRGKNKCGIANAGSTAIVA